MSWTTSAASRKPKLYSVTSNHTLSPSVDLTVGGLALLLAVALATRADARFT